MNVDDIVETKDGAIGLIVDWTDHGMRPGIFTINWDETTYTGSPPPRHWTRAQAEALAVRR